MQAYRVRCKRCGKVFLKTKPAEKYCSDECRNEANREQTREAQRRRKERLAQIEAEASKKQKEPQIIKEDSQPVEEEPLKQDLPVEKLEDKEPDGTLINCERCGIPMVKKGPMHKYCPECARKFEKIRDEKRLKELNKKNRRSRAGNNAENDSACRVAKSCVYGIAFDGTVWCCGYRSIMKRCRTFGDNYGKHGIFNGKCDLYRKRTKGGRTK